MQISLAEMSLKIDGKKHNSLNFNKKKYFTRFRILIVYLHW